MPITDEERQWVDDGFGRLQKFIGRHRMLEARVVLPTPEDFPDPYDKTADAAEKLFCRVCSYMHVKRKRIDFQVFPDETEELREVLPHWHGNEGTCAAGMYQQGDDGETTDKGLMIVAIRSTQLKDPMALVATMAHELGHVILIGGGLIRGETPDHEPLTDLLTVFLGLGIFTANSAARFRQFQDERHYGWSMQQLGYLPEEVFGYALARFMAERGEEKPKWMSHLSPNIRAYTSRSRAWLKQNAGPALRTSD